MVNPLCSAKPVRLKTSLNSWGKVFWLFVCRFPRCSDAGGGALPLSACNTFRSDAFLLLVDNLGILIEGNLLMCSSRLPLWVPNSATNINFTLRKHQAFFWHHYTHQAFFWRRCQGTKEAEPPYSPPPTQHHSSIFLAPLPGRKITYARGVSHSQSFYFVIFFAFLFLLYFVCCI